MAVDHNRRVRIGRYRFDALLEKAARDMDSFADVSSGPFVILSDIEQQEFFFSIEPCFHFFDRCFLNVSFSICHHLLEFRSWLCRLLSYSRSNQDSRNEHSKCCEAHSSSHLRQKILSPSL